jgi:hypothetical protein
MAASAANLQQTLLFRLKSGSELTAAQGAPPALSSNGSPLFLLFLQEINSG